jgi:RimJ/RimL family protein N-acetyltransferase
MLELPLKTPRLTIREFERSDSGSLAALDFRSPCPSAEQIGMAGAGIQFDRTHPCPQVCSSFRLGFFTVLDGCLVGTLALEPVGGCVDVSYEAAPCFEGRGYTKEAFTCLVHALFTQTQTPTVRTRIKPPKGSPDHLASIRVSEHAGLQYRRECGTLPVYEITRSEWLSRKPPSA